MFLSCLGVEISTKNNVPNFMIFGHFLEFLWSKSSNDVLFRCFLLISYMTKAFSVEKEQLLNFHLKPYHLYLPYLPGISVYVGGGQPAAKLEEFIQWTGLGLAKTGMYIPVTRRCLASRRP